MTTQAVISARYSSDRQSTTSAEDQARLCRTRIGPERWDLVEIFADLPSRALGAIGQGSTP